MPKSEHLEIEEYDEAGNVVTTYIVSDGSRVDVVVRSFSADWKQDVLIKSSFRERQRATLNGCLMCFYLRDIHIV